MHGSHVCFDQADVSFTLHAVEYDASWKANFPSAIDLWALCGANVVTLLKRKNLPATPCGLFIPMKQESLSLQSRGSTGEVASDTGTNRDT